MFSCVSNLGIFLDKGIEKVAGRGDLAEADRLLVLFWQFSVFLRQNCLRGQRTTSLGEEENSFIATYLACSDAFVMCELNKNFRGANTNLIFN